MKKIKVGSDFSGVGAFDQALKRLGVKYETVFACDMDKYARDTFIHNYGEPKYYPMNVYDREIPTESLDIYMTSPPCQAFSLAGKRLGKDDKRGILFFNSHEFIHVNKPRFFIFENVKGLLSDDGGRTFQEWVNMLGGKSVNGLPVLFPDEEAVPYHLYWQVLNAKKHGVPQNRERVFLIGIRDDSDNSFQFPKEEHLTKRLKDVLDDDVDEKYFLSEKMVSYLTNRSDNFNNGKINYKDENSVASTITKSSSSIDISDNIIVVENTNPCGHGQNGNVYHEEGISPTLSTNKGEGIKIKSATSKGYELAQEGDSINFSVLTSETRRVRVGKGVAQTLDTACNQAILQKYPSLQNGKGNILFHRKGFATNTKVYDIENECGTIDTCQGGGIEPHVLIKENIIYNDKRLNETIAKNELPEGIPMAIDTYNQKVQENSPTLTEPHHNTTRLWDGYRIRRLTPRECFRLMDFPDTFTWNVSDSQAYKQAGNSIVVNVLYKILKQLPI